MQLDAFDRRLDPAGQRPIAVALSGGADSLSALIATVSWAKAHGRPVLALSVDHGLQAASAAWTQEARRQAAKLGCDFQALRWEGPKPRTGVPKAARLARHRLLADAARRAGARVLVVGHTGDDALENAEMGLGALAEWSPSPVWPQGRGLALLRQLLAERRSILRERLGAWGWIWVEDPANADPAHPRIAARRRLGGRGTPPAPPDEAATADLARQVGFNDEMFRLSRRALSAAPTEAGLKVIAAAAVCAGGGQAPPRRDRVEALAGRLRHSGRVVATLAGARILAQGDDISIVREAGEARRGGLAAISLPGVWDGRYELGGKGEVGLLKGLAARLPPSQRQALARWPAAARPALPAIVEGGAVTCPLLAADSDHPVQPLMAGRFRLACGVYAHERDIGLWLR